MSTAAEETPSRQREWWLRTLAVFQSPMPGEYLRELLPMKAAAAA